MTRIALLLIMILSTAMAFCQGTVEGIIKDKSTGRPVSYASISTADSRHHTVSNEEGKFVFSYPAGNNNFIISCLGYSPLVANLSNLPQNQIYYLEPRNFELDEIIIMNTPIDEFLESLIENSKKRLSSPVTLNTYYREFVNINDKYTKFADGLVDYHLYKKGKKIKTELKVRQSRSAFLKYQEEGFVGAIGPDVRRAVQQDCEFLFFESFLLSGKAYKNYNFVFRSKNDTTGVITFSPKENIEKALFEGTIIYNPEQNIILEADVKMKPSLRKFAKVTNIILARYSIEDMAYKSSFKIVDGNYIFVNSSISGVMHIWKKNSYNNTYFFKSDLVVTDFTTNAKEFSDAERYKLRSLYDRGNNYQDKFWLENNAIPLTDEEEQIIQTLNNTQTIQTK